MGLNYPSTAIATGGGNTKFLTSPSTLSTFLRRVFTRDPLGVSVGAEVNIRGPSRFRHLLSVFSRCPVRGLVIRPHILGRFCGKGIRQRTCIQTGRELDTTTTSRRAIRQAVPIYCGNSLFDISSAREFLIRCPNTSSLVFNEKVLVSPTLIVQLHTQEASLTRGGTTGGLHLRGKDAI